MIHPPPQGPPRIDVAPRARQRVTTDGDDVAKRGVRARTRDDDDDDDANANAHDASQCDDAGGDSGAHRGTVRRGRCADLGG